jgi:hypothetical protein
MLGLGLGFRFHSVKPQWILERGATGLRESDLHVFGKFFGDRLERRLEVKEPPIAPFRRLGTKPKT